MSLVKRCVMRLAGTIGGTASSGSPRKRGPSAISTAPQFLRGNDGSILPAAAVTVPSLWQRAEDRCGRQHPLPWRICRMFAHSSWLHCGHRPGRGFRSVEHQHIHHRPHRQESGISGHAFHPALRDAGAGSTGGHRVCRTGRRLGRPRGGRRRGARHAGDRRGAAAGRVVRGRVVRRTCSRRLRPSPPRARNSAVHPFHRLPSPGMLPEPGRRRGADRIPCAGLCLLRAIAVEFGACLVARSHDRDVGGFVPVRVLERLQNQLAAVRRLLRLDIRTSRPPAMLRAMVPQPAHLRVRQQALPVLRRAQHVDPQAFGYRCSEGAAMRLRLGSAGFGPVLCACAPVDVPAGKPAMQHVAVVEDTRTDARPPG